MATAKQAPAKAAPGKAVAKVEPKSTAVQQSDIGLEMLLKDAQEHKQTFNKDDLAIPFIRVLQKGSPQVNKRDDAYIEGAEPGMFIDTTTGQLYDGENEGILVTPISYTPSYIAWRPRDEGGGIVRDYGADASVMNQTQRNEDGKDVMADGSEVVRSGQYFVFLINETTGEFEMKVLALSGTQLKKSRKWNTMIQSLRIPRGDGIPGTFTPAPFYATYRIKTLFEKNDKGDWMGVDIKPEGSVISLPNGSNIYLAARDFKAMIDAGRVQVKHDEETVEAEIEVETGAESDDKF